MAPATCPKCEAQLTYQPPAHEVAAAGIVAEYFAWVLAILVGGALAAIGASYYWVGALLGAIAGLAIFLKLAHDTETDPAEGLYFCAPCKRYFKASAIKAANGAGSAI